ncbi:dienelactone hydrolase family protein [Galbibacter sp. EGI 63066]|uniref:dienelactone hydrolase family protein n=1 Tax=Galbibacter sp. EGI 63066 TaxID=2993559 RepID=UPI0022491DCD|nr:dienelactone hydrolase family protein [Galbibacter sp. EGI 63066]MCX2679249.1 dienelactone hydrolase family protein [Galbibacter sp. EGI 63066]
MRTLSLLLVFCVLIACKNKTNKETNNEVAAETASTISDELAVSERHHEWVDLKRGDGTFKAFVVYPESDTPTQAVIVIHENRGLNDWARSFTDQLAAEGYLAIAPDLISNTVEGIEKTTDFENSDKAREAIYALDPDQVTEDLNTTYEYIKNDPASNNKIFVVGFCWGGSQSFRYATNNPDLEKALVFYGTAPKDKSVLEQIKCPVYGFYGGNDNRVNSTIPDTEKAMEKYDKKYEHVIYDGAGHAFMRRGAESDADEANKTAHDKAWESLLKLLNK